jgi:hypothetical protein
MKKFYYLFFIIMIVSCNDFIYKPTNEIDLNFIESEYVDIIVDNHFEFHREERSQTESYCGNGGIVNCGNGSKKLFINGLGPFIQINKLKYFFINDGSTDHEGANRAKRLEIEFLSLNNDSSFRPVSWCGERKALTTGIFDYSGRNFKFAIEAVLDDKAFCHLVNNMAIRIGPDYDSLLIIRYFEDVSKEYFKRDWDDLSKLTERQTALLVEFKNNSKKIIDCAWKPVKKMNI